MTPELASAIKTIETAMASMQPIRRVGSDQWSQQRLYTEHQLSSSQYKLWAAIRTVGETPQLPRSTVPIIYCHRQDPVS